jgi:chaperone BCS1
MEGLDAVFRDAKAAGRAAGVSFSGLRKIVGGRSAQEGRARIVTTDRRDRLNPAQIRPGRAGLHVELGRIGADTAARLLSRFFAAAADGTARSLVTPRRHADARREAAISPAEAR